jgi:hypothetical protein
LYSKYIIYNTFSMPSYFPPPCIYLSIWGSFCLLGVQNVLLEDAVISGKLKVIHSAIVWKVSQSVLRHRSVIEASIVLCSVSLWLVWVNVQSTCALNTRYRSIYGSTALCWTLAAISVS